ncbi:MAG: hypothetical protein COW30_16010 [Rhodospirillales bacterium CG15_BIG_FIL_POST_REV_8_21_14_020_66_15]|nr:MAG: hypothetical protein COW30_16010 [Rhodospirillales bacterium CG15_BIG_FIL_POST_REV_8_21_14_020_66_15]
MIKTIAMSCAAYALFVGVAGADQNVVGEYHGVYAFCKNQYPCDDEAFTRARQRKNNIAVKIWQEDGQWKVRFSPPDHWTNFPWPTEAHFTEVTDNKIRFKVDRPNDHKTLDMEGTVTDGTFAGKILYNDYTMDGRLTRE